MDVLANWGTTKAANAEIDSGGLRWSLRTKELVAYGRISSSDNSVVELVNVHQKNGPMIGKL
jgi:hypothetical protein